MGRVPCGRQKSPVGERRHLEFCHRTYVYIMLVGLPHVLFFHLIVALSRLSGGFAVSTASFDADYYATSVVVLLSFHLMGRPCA